MKKLLSTRSADRLSLRANFSWTFVGNVVYSVCQWGLIVVLAKLGSPEVVGQYTIALAVTTPVFMLTNMRLDTVQTTDRDDANVFGDYLGLRMLCSLLALVSIAAMLWASDYGKGVIGIVALVGLAKFVESISDVVYGLMQKEERLDLMARSLMLRGLLSLAATAATFYFLRSLLATLVIQIIVWSGVLWGYDLPNACRWQSVRPLYRPRQLTGLFVLALPLGIVSGLNSLSTQVPRYIMERFAGQRELGIFAAIVSLGMVADLAITALSRSALPRLAQLYAQGAVRSFVRLLLRLMGIGAVLGALGVIGAALLGEPLLRIVYAEEYAAYQNVLIVVMVSIDVMTTFTFLGTAVTAAQQFAVQVLAQVAKVTAIGLACWVLIPRLGALGAAWGALVGALVSSLLYFVILWRTMRRTRARACYTLLNLTS